MRSTVPVAAPAVPVPVLQWMRRSPPVTPTYRLVRCYDYSLRVGGQPVLARWSDGTVVMARSCWSRCQIWSHTLQHCNTMARPPPIAATMFVRATRWPTRRPATTT